MKELLGNWLLQFWGDEDMWKYGLLDYVKSAYNELDNQRLFPAWESVYQQYVKSKQFAKGWRRLEGLQPHELVNTNLEKMELEYRIKSHSGWREYEAIQGRLEFALPLLKKICKSSESFRKQVNSEVEFGPVGVLVSNRKEGLLYLMNENQARIDCWKYFASVQTDADKNYSFLRTKFVGKYSQSFSESFQAIRKRCAKDAGLDGLVFSSWLLQSKAIFPFFHTLKPIGVMNVASELLL